MEDDSGLPAFFDNQLPSNDADFCLEASPASSLAAEHDVPQVLQSGSNARGKYSDAGRTSRQSAPSRPPSYAPEAPQEPRQSHQLNTEGRYGNLQGMGSRDANPQLPDHFLAGLSSLNLTSSNTSTLDLKSGADFTAARRRALLSATDNGDAWVKPGRSPTSTPGAPLAGNGLLPGVLSSDAPVFTPSSNSERLHHDLPSKGSNASIVEPGGCFCCGPSLCSSGHSFETAPASARSSLASADSNVNEPGCAIATEFAAASQQYRNDSFSCNKPIGAKSQLLGNQSTPPAFAAPAAAAAMFRSPDNGSLVDSASVSTSSSTAEPTGHGAGRCRSRGSAEDERSSFAPSVCPGSELSASAMPLAAATYTSNALSALPPGCCSYGCPAPPLPSAYSSSLPPPPTRDSGSFGPLAPDKHMMPSMAGVSYDGKDFAPSPPATHPVDMFPAAYSQSQPHGFAKAGYAYGMVQRGGGPTQQRRDASDHVARYDGSLLQASPSPWEMTDPRMSGSVGVHGMGSVRMMGPPPGPPQLQNQRSSEHERSSRGGSIGHHQNRGSGHHHSGAAPPTCGMAGGGPMQQQFGMPNGAEAMGGGIPMGGAPGMAGLEHGLNQVQMMNLQHTVMKLTLVAPNKQELRKMLQSMLSQERVAEAHVMVGMMRMVGLPVDVVMYNLLMTAYKKRRQWQLVMQVMQQMQASSVMPDIVSYNILIDACGKAQQLQRAFAFYDEMIRNGLQPGVNTYTSLIDACGKTQQLKRAYELLDQMQREGVQPNAHTFTTIINACTQAQDLDLGLQVLEQMISCGAGQEVGQSTVTPYTTLIRACGKAFAVDKAFAVLRCMLDVGLKPNTVTFNCLIDACSKAHELDKAFHVLRLMYHYNNPPDTVTYSALIDACLRSQELGKAFELLAQMQHDHLTPSSSMYTSLLDASIKARDIPRIFEVLHLMGGAGVRPSNPAFISIIQACGKANQFDRAFDTLSYMKCVHVRPNAAVYAALVEVAVEAQDLQRAIWALQEVTASGETVEASVFNSLIHLCGIRGQIEYALQMFEYMRKVQVLPNSVTFKTLIAACVKCGELSRAEQAMLDMSCAGWEPELPLIESLLSAYIARGETPVQILRVCDRLQRDVLSAMGRQHSLLPTLLECCVSCGEYDRAAEILSQSEALGHFVSRDVLAHLSESMTKSQQAGENAAGAQVLQQLIQEKLVAE